MAKGYMPGRDLLTGAAILPRHDFDSERSYMYLRLAETQAFRVSERRDYVLRTEANLEWRRADSRRGPFRSLRIESKATSLGIAHRRRGLSILLRDLED